MYTTILNRSEKEFWNSTLRKIVSQINIHMEIKNGGAGQKNNKKEGTKIVNNKEYEVLKVN